METATVTTKGQVTIPKAIRQRFGIRQGSRIELSLVGDHVEMRVRGSPAATPASGFGLLKTRRKSVPADMNPEPYPSRPSTRGPVNLGRYTTA